jgi:hypothetical protein
MGIAAGNLTQRDDPQDNAAGARLALNGYPRQRCSYLSADHSCPLM